MDSLVEPNEPASLLGRSHRPMDFSEVEVGMGATRHPQEQRRLHESARTLVIQ